MTAGFILLMESSRLKLVVWTVVTSFSLWVSVRVVAGFMRWTDNVMSICYNGWAPVILSRASRMWVPLASLRLDWAKNGECSNVVLLRLKRLFLLAMRRLLSNVTDVPYLRFLTLSVFCELMRPSCLCNRDG